MNIQKPPKWIIGAVAGVLLIVLAVFISTSVLTGNDKAVYDLINAHKYEFKDPSSVQLVTADYFDNEGDPVVWATISATNGYGARVTNCYAFTNSYSIESDNCGRTNVNISKINKKLREN